MAKKESSSDKKVHKVMHEWKHGTLKSGKSNKKVKSHDQAVAIALSEAGKSKYKKSSRKKKSV